MVDIFWNYLPQERLEINYLKILQNADETVTVQQVWMSEEAPTKLPSHRPLLGINWYALASKVSKIIFDCSSDSERPKKLELLSGCWFSGTQYFSILYSMLLSAAERAGQSSFSRGWCHFCTDYSLCPTRDVKREGSTVNHLIDSCLQRMRWVTALISNLVMVRFDRDIAAETGT